MDKRPPLCFDEIGRPLCGRAEPYRLTKGLVQTTCDDCLDVVVRRNEPLARAVAALRPADEDERDER